MALTIRPVKLSDAPEILKIYAPYINSTPITFETEVPSIETFQERIKKNHTAVSLPGRELEGKIVGYAYASQYRERAAYRYSTELSIYVDQSCQRQGIGKALYTQLFQQLKTYGFYTAYACITLPNENSVRLHQAFGFQKIGVFHNAGYKAGKWLDVLWMEKPLEEYGVPGQE